MSAVLAALSVFVGAVALGVVAGAIVEEIDSRRHLSGSDVLGGATAMGVFVLVLFVGLLTVL